MVESELASLVSPEWLAGHLADHDVRVYDTTVHLRPGPPDVAYEIVSGLVDYEASHIPGAGFLDLTKELSDRSTDLPFMMPGAEQMQAALEAAGVGDGSRVVLYSTSSPMWATRVWWMLRSCGLDNVAVLDGGFARWRSEGRPVTTEACGYDAGSLSVAPRPGLWADRDEVLAAIGDGGVCTLNALSHDMHTGEAKIHYGRPGRIRGSCNVPWEALLEGESFRSLERSRSAFEAVGAFDKPHVITYCGGGIAATLDAFVLTRLGHTDVAVYDGSMREWASDEASPMDVGES
jgi:thiosulfate/3-mercaptopyruvate sulfurtransferase